MWSGCRTAHSKHELYMLKIGREVYACEKAAFCLRPPIPERGTIQCGEPGGMRLTMNGAYSTDQLLLPNRIVQEVPTLRLIFS